MAHSVVWFEVIGADGEKDRALVSRDASYRGHAVPS
jgi:hypothetical protein